MFIAFSASPNPSLKNSSSRINMPPPTKVLEQIPFFQHLGHDTVSLSQNTQKTPASHALLFGAGKKHSRHLNEEAKKVLIELVTAEFEQVSKNPEIKYPGTAAVGNVLQDLKSKTPEQLSELDLPWVPLRPTLNDLVVKGGHIKNDSFMPKLKKSERLTTDERVELIDVKTELQGRNMTPETALNYLNLNSMSGGGKIYEDYGLSRLPTKKEYQLATLRENAAPFSAEEKKVFKTLVTSLKKGRMTRVEIQSFLNEVDQQETERTGQTVKIYQSYGLPSLPTEEQIRRA